MRRLKAVELFFFILLGIMAVYMCVYAATAGRRLFDNDYNSRTRLLSGRNTRGTIYSQDGRILAETRTVTDADGTASEKRVYPYAEVFAHIVGYSVNGRSGIEDLEDYYLVRSDVSLNTKAELDKKGEKYPGNEIHTTLDTVLQYAAYEALEGYKGAIVVTEPSTGRILAMVSRPDYDPNNILEIWDEITQDNTSGRLMNRASQGLYPPGSTFKIIDAAAFLEQDSLAAESYSYDCTGSMEAGDTVISCFHGSIHYEVDFTDSLVQSCNCSFANIGLLLDQTEFDRMLARMYFDRQLPFDLPCSRSTTGLTGSKTTAEIMQLSIGQGTTAMTPLHMNMITAAIANNGMMMQPYCVDSVMTAEGGTVEVYSPQELKSVISEETAAKVADMMTDVVLEGTGRGLRSELYTAAGKTGSAEYSSTGMSHAWFTGFAPAENPEICITVVLEGAGNGSAAAVPAAKHVLDAWFSR